MLIKRKILSIILIEYILFRKNEGEEMEAGKMINLKVDRESDLGYILSNGNREEEILLHYNDCAGNTCQIGDEVNVFLYFDHKKRLSATLETPKITVFDCNWVKVVNVVSFGVFVDIGTKKDVLCSSDDLPLNKQIWPQVDDMLYAYLVNDNDKGFLLKLATREDFLEIKQDAPKDVYGNKLEVRVIRIGSEGINVISNEGYLGFIHHSEYKEERRLGSLVEGRVINVKLNNELNLSLIPQKEIAMIDDTELILNYINTHDGKMPLGDASSPDEIKSILDISKAAFKRAIGKLMRENKVVQNDDKKVTSIL